MVLSHFVSRVLLRRLQRLVRSMNAWRLSTIIGAVLALTGPNVRGSVHISEEQARQWAVSTPQPKYPEAARLRRITGLGYFKLRVNRATGRVTEITVLRSTRDHLLDASAISTLRQWRFRGCRVLPSIRQIDPSTREPFADRDLFIGVPVQFVLERNGVISKT